MVRDEVLAASVCVQFIIRRHHPAVCGIVIKKHRKAAYEEKKQRTKEQIEAIYHKHNGVDGYRMMKAYLERKGIVLSAQTVHKYMNTELGLMSVTRRKPPEYKKGKPHILYQAAEL